MTETDGTQPLDIFLWANQADGVKKELDFELFLFNRGYTPYSVSLSPELDASLRALFLFDMVNFVNMGAGTGLSVRDFEYSEGEENVLLRTDLSNVGRAETLIHLIEHERGDIVEFNDEDHDFKRIKGMLARFTDKTKPGETFYIAKAISQGSVLKAASSWELRAGKLGAFQAEVGLKVPPDNQVLIAGGSIFAFNQPKFEKLFNYDYKKQAIADKKVAEITAQYRLSFPEGMDLNTLVRDRKKTIEKLQTLEVGAVKQEQLVDYADTMQLELMTDDSGAIIIMDGNDLDMFVGLMNEDYMTSDITGKRYEIKSKKLLGEPDGEPPRG